MSLSISIVPFFFSCAHGFTLFLTPHAHSAPRTHSCCQFLRIGLCRFNNFYSLVLTIFRINVNKTVSRAPSGKKHAWHQIKSIKSVQCTCYCFEANRSRCVRRWAAQEAIFYSYRSKTIKLFVFMFSVKQIVCDLFIFSWDRPTHWTNRFYWKKKF